ncbi:alkyl hydroperoxide reductase [Ferroacidibacillus organovorans]|uniref:Alkyl hydroperoxide reductase n=4 Tax=Ferroacidibacillus organovorans TaxID=1765683 RepID=A0A117SY39_9BACL|nr:alkyl hydroperoxide reductase [Ferroacidibacillus organovorans]KYP80312.1 alkyl hydroperoxide reductase [Ferroacidibacillus organovorans]OAG86759.1 alkyl hydroperoxide reductase [Ferroacidibacillus organovorans]
MPSYEDDLSRFEEYNTQVLGISVDSIPSHEAWQKSIGGISYPLCSDFYPHGAVAEKFGVLRSEGFNERALFVIDKEGVVRFIDVHPIDKQPDNEVIFDVLRQLRD